MQSITIKRLTAADTDFLLPFARRMFFEAFSHNNSRQSMQQYAAKAFTVERFTEELKNSDSEFHLATLNDQPAGYLKLNFNEAQTEFRESQALEVERIYVDGNFQGKNIGGQLLIFAVETAQQRGLDYVWLGVWENNQGAIKFYQRHGFSIVSSHQFFLGDEEQTDLIMKRSLNTEA
ncbi:GNAT family N-acetyltransferase [Mucilaginibacter limnophilus]|uniref:GNAT family N-acetyltransferase n=1 Tax=Mucilaginibacter limnophilus TaxID=1932778 RepID=A0A3S2VML8_9SPHI|nr:GNAT family N-acetyltransferase [Mucilaginibacter limnophilus]RVU00864.1 GNAT family N-acetyltransferase [Mucilaginibacter limnophilus]